MNKSNYIEQQKERGLQIIRDLYDLNKILPAIKVSEGMYFNFYDEKKCTNWKKELEIGNLKRCPF